MKLEILILFSIAWLHVQAKNPCIVNSDCGSCLRANGECAFCKDSDYTEGDNYARPRCNYKNVLEGFDCKDIMDIQGKITEVKKDPFQPTVQISPQKVSVKLRPAQTKEIKLSVKPAVDFPVDLYYLMDMSKSMEDDLEKLRSLGTQIADAVGGITKYYKLAFGSFVDKTVAPFIQPAQLDKPCELELTQGACVKTFGYKHVLDFTDDKNTFQSQINAQKISGNLDTPEGGFDAMMQVASCNTTLQWRSIDKAHRIVVFVTDALPHIAGDGKLGGITTPNDARCHLTNTNTPKFYDKLNELDYPSISKLKDSLKNSGIIPIFAVTESVLPVYKFIGEEWKDLNTAVGKLKGDSSNIVTLIKEKYSEIIKTIRMSDDSPKEIVVKYKVDESCLKPSEDKDFCQEVKAGQTYGFTASLTAVSCPDKKDWDKKHTFTITAPGLGKVEVEVELICECECEKSGEDNSAKCKNHGTYKCGICYCNPGRFGEICECDEKTQADDSKCKQANSTNPDVVCSNAGSCVCGKCVCNKRDNSNEKISGKYCECNNYGCDRYDGKLCGGPGRGECDCGECKCTEAFLGDNCGEVNCTLGEKNCIGPDGLKCSGKGQCACDTCDCERGYGGKYCQECVSCPSKCSNYKDCVQCVAWDEGPFAEDNTCEQRCSQYDIQMVNETRADCEYKDDNNCFFHYRFEKINDGNETILVQKDKRCIIVFTKPTPVLAIVLGIIGGLILLALILLLLWKLLITAYDNYEYQKFLKENQNPNWANTDNPIYKPSQTNYQNPTYAGKS